MKYPSILKAVTLIFFVAMLGLVILYQTGKLDYYFASENATRYSSPNGGVLSGSSTDTTVSNPQALTVNSGGVVNKDSLARMKRWDSLSPSQRSAEEMRLSSSKSMVIRPLSFPLTTTPGQFSLKPKKQKKKN